MLGARKFFAYLLTFVLFASLLAAALSTSAYIALSHPNKIETWLNQSNLYQHFVSETIAEAKKTAGSSEAQGSVTLSDAAVQQAANSAFTISLFQKSLNTFLDSNYAWLQGKSTQPSFTIDLTGAKQDFANQVGQYVQDHIASLPVCSAQQLAEIGSVNDIDPLNITCRPPTLDPKAEAALVTQKIENSSDFLANPVITANNINPKGGSSSNPYYQKYSNAPQVYQAAVKLPWAYGAVAVLCATGVIFLSARKRLGLRRVGYALAAAGIVLVIIRFVSGASLKNLEKHLFNNANIGQLQQALTSFLDRVEQQLVKVDLWFGIGFLLLALLIFLVLRFTRNRQPKPQSPAPPATPEDGGPLSERLRHDLPPAPGPTEPRPEPLGPPPPPPAPKKKSRLVQ
jgi:hypothetical protein